MVLTWYELPETVGMRVKLGPVPGITQAGGRLLTQDASSLGHTDPESVSDNSRQLPALSRAE